MPQINRDKETLYPPGKLSRIFLVSSGLLLAALAWMLLADHYARPWRGVQRSFFETQAHVLDDVRAREKERLNRPEARQAREALMEKIRAAEAAEAAKADDVARLEAERKRLKEKDADIDRDVKAVKGRLSEKRYAAELVRLDVTAGRASASDLERAQRPMNDEASELGRLLDDQRTTLASLSDVEAKLAAVGAEKAALVAEYEKSVESFRSYEKQHEAAVAKTERDQWRNQWLADIVSPTIQIQKVVLDHIHDDFNFATSAKVDMCTTCHMGADSALFREEPALLDKHGVTQVHRPHPAFDLMVGPKSKHPLPKTGCTVCHEGRGWSTDFDRAFHTPRLSHVEAAKERSDLGRAEAAAREVLGTAEADLRSGKVAKEAVAVARTALEDVEKRLAAVNQEERWREEWGWKPFEFYDWPMLPMKHVEGQCLKCHLPALFYPPETERLQRWETRIKDDGTAENRRRTAPVPVASRPAGAEAAVREEGLRSALAAAQDLLAKATIAKESGQGSDEAVRVAQDALALAKERLAVETVWHPERLEHGTKTILEWGCNGCHVVKGFGVTPGWPPPNLPSPEAAADLSAPEPGTLNTLGRPRVGPDLRHLADKTTRDFIEKWVRNPTSYRIDTRMPSFYLYRAHDDDYRPLEKQVPDGQGGTRAVPDDRTVIVEPDAQDLARIEVEVQALTEFLYRNSAEPRRAYEEPPAGDPERGRMTADTVGCAACHLLPERRDARTGTWRPDDGARFRGALPPGPRLTALGSKVNAKWLDAWLAEPRHYWSTTRMPNMRWDDETGPDGKTVVRTARQVRADVVAWLLSFRDPAFDAMGVPSPDWSAPGSVHKTVLDMMYEEYWGKDQSPSRVKDAIGKLSPADELFRVGQKLVGQRGCFGCHAVAGYENAQPIGTELTSEGSKDLHMLDFALIGHDEVPETRWDWIEKKLENPRIWDRGRIKPWQDKLRMPKFNFRTRDREAVATTVLGFVREPIKHEAKFHPTQAQQQILAGRAVIERYNCNQCHNIEGRQGVLWADQVAQGKELWMLPPNLYGEGNRARAEWLFTFLKAPFEVRPSVLQRMPMFRMSDEEASALVQYFLRLADRPDRVSDPLDAPLDPTPYAEPVTIRLKEKDAEGNEVEKAIPVRDRIEEAKALFDTMNCVKCHLPKGTPGADPNEGASAPPFTLAAARLQRAWMHDLLEKPEYQIQGTKMTEFWPAKRKKKIDPVTGRTLDSRTLNFPEFQFHLRGQADAAPDDVSDAQMQMLVRYLLYHYQGGAAPALAGK